MGSFGVVRKAMHRASETHCVVKSLKKAQSGAVYKSQVESGLYDQLMLMSVRHPHEAIVKYLDMFESEEWLLKLIIYDICMHLITYCIWFNHV